MAHLSYPARLPLLDRALDVLAYNLHRYHPHRDVGAAVGGSYESRLRLSAPIARLGYLHHVSPARVPCSP